MFKLRSLILMTLALTCICTGVFAASSSQARPPTRIVLFSDNDDTLEITGIKAFRFWKIISNVTFRHEAFAGMGPLYRALSQKGVEIQYVSGGTTPQITKLFLRANNFPEGPLTYRTNLQAVRGLKIFEFKFIAIKEIIKNIKAQSPDTKFIFVGDNGQQDSLTGKMLAEDPEVKNDFLHFDIHTLYPPQVARPLASGQFGFPTAAELSLQYQALGLIDSTDVNDVLKDIVQNPELAIPNFGHVTKAEARALEHKAESIVDRYTRALVKRVATVERNRCVDPMSNLSLD